MNDLNLFDDVYFLISTIYYFLKYQSTTPRWRLWNPEHEVSTEDLWNDVLSAAGGDSF